MNLKLKKAIDKIGNKEITLLFFSVIDRILFDLNLENESERISLTATNNHRLLNLNINSRLAFSISNDLNFLFMIKENDLSLFKDKLSFTTGEPFSYQEPKAVLVHIAYKDVQDNLEFIYKYFFNCCSEYIRVQESSQYRNAHISEMYECADNELVLEHYLNSDIKILQLLENYKTHLKTDGPDEELYKWELLAKYQNKPNLNAPDILEEFKDIDYSNLIYGIGIGVLRHLAKDKPKKFKAALEVLFNEEMDLEDRIVKYRELTHSAYRELVPDKTKSTHQDERTIATLLTYKYPEKYTFYKSSFYGKYCKLLNIKARPAGEKYIHYLSLVNELIENDIKEDTFLRDHFETWLPKDVFQDENCLILAQDILYINLDKGIGQNESDLNNNQHELMLNKINIKKQLYPLYFLKCLMNKQSEKDIIDKIQELIQTIENGTITTVIYRTAFSNFTKQDKQAAMLIYNNIIKEDIDYNTYASFVLSKIFKTNFDLIDFLNNITKEQIEAKLNKDGSYEYNIQESNVEETIIPLNKTNNPLNQILYGPPGTGKTYHSINKAIEICNPNFDLNQNRETIKKEYDRLHKEGQIVFTTFHQSMSYEDFIEGIKPDTIDNNVIYNKEAGIFKKLCNKAKTKKIQNNNFEEAYDKLLDEIDNEGENGIILETLVHSKEFTIYKNSKGNIKFHANTEKAYLGVIRKDFLEHYLKTKEALDWPSYVKSIAQYLETEYHYKQEEISENKNYVLIIDEVNRGNVSSIFGELITLIETNKRAGNKEELSITLPYSGEKFSVPNNLYIIGTMNTADRSVEALDTALRRRFSFEEMMPQYDLDVLGKVEDFKLGEVLKTINDRIEVLIDRDHTIGHSYFIGIDSPEELLTAFNDKIIPLLQEYFYGDYGKIGLVLGEGFVEEVKKKKNLFTAFKYEGKDDLNASFYKLKSVKVEELKKAIELLLNLEKTEIE